MSARKATTTRALFLELVLDLVIFAICAVICLQVFASAHLESSRSAALSRLGIEAQEIAELFKAGSDDASADALAVKPFAQQDGDTIAWHYRQDLSPATDDDAYFTLACTVDDSQPVAQARITLTEGSTQLFVYDVSSYRPANGGGS
jgi:Tfp pilus assembly protein PilE